MVGPDARDARPISWHSGPFRHPIPRSTGHCLIAIAIQRYGIDYPLHVHQNESVGAAVEDVTRACTERGICWEHRKVGREAVRIITLAFDNVYETPFYDEDETEDQNGMVE